MQRSKALERLIEAQAAYDREISASRGDYPSCVRCGLPVKVNRDSYDVFEKMHYLCFHLEFEHGDADPDEFCGVPGCQWDRNSFKQES